MIKPITQNELAELAASLPSGELCDWCNQCGCPGSQMVVYADGEMLSRCLAAANSLTSESESNQESKPIDEDIQGQSGPTVDPIADVGKGEEDT